MTHEEMREQIMLLALDALTEAEGREARAHLETCSNCRALFAEHQQALAQLLAQVPTVDAPNVTTQLRARVRAFKSDTTPRASILTAVRHGWQSFWGLPRWVRASAFTLLLILLIGSLATLWPQPIDEREEYVKLRSQPDVVKVRLTGTDIAPEATGQVVIDPKTNQAYLAVWNLKKLSKDYVYQVWLVREGGRDNGGLLTVVDPKEAIVALKSPRPFSTYREIGLTIEPANGSSNPTTPRVMGGYLR